MTNGLHERAIAGDRAPLKDGHRSMTRVITFGTYDVLHVGHLRLLARARSLGDFLIVGISTDELNLSKKSRRPVYSLAERIEIVSALRMVDTVFAEESLERKRDYLLEHRADVLVMGDDWQGRFDQFNDVCRVVYLPRTPAVSTTETIERIRL
jgi:glycerol-3-phosphate cytidylyltransferase